MAMKTSEERRDEIGPICVFCQSFYFFPEVRAWSEVTPGDAAEMGCHKGIVQIDLLEDTETSYRKKILTARTCEEYQPVDLSTLTA